jgi:Ca-activated chloride channel family protein
MKITAKFDYNKVPAQKSFTVRLMLTIDEEYTVKQNRKPLNLSLALDNSGSMGGHKIHNVREATKHLVRQLSPEDLFSLTIFNDTVHELIEPTHIERIQAIEIEIDSILASGRTFLSGGYDLARKLADQNLGCKYVTRVILLTDGQANVGIVDHDELSQMADAMRLTGITTTTIGVGADYEESLLSRMAESGGGGSYYIETPQDASSVFSEELGLLQRIVATDCQVMFVPEIQNLLYSQLNSYPVLENGYWLVGDIYGNKKRTLVLECTVPPMSADQNLSMGHFLISYKDAATVAVTHKVEIQAIIGAISPNAFMSISADRDVTIEAWYLVIARAKAEAIKLSDRDLFEEAAQLLENYAKELQAVVAGDPFLEKELRNLRRRAEKLRENGTSYYTSMARKRMHHESDMMSKSKLGSYAAMLSRREGKNA